MKACQFLRRRFADLTDAHREEPAVERLVAGPFEGVDHLRGVLLAEAPWLLLGSEIQASEHLLRQREEVERGPAEFAADESLGHGFADSLDVQRLARGELLDLGHGLGGAFEIGAAPGDKAFFLGYRSAAGRTLSSDVLQQREWPGSGGALPGDHLDDGRNDLSSLLDDYGVADADVLPLDFLLVVQGGARDGGAGNQHRLQLRHRCQNAGATDLDGDVLEHGLHLFRQELVGSRPAGRAGGRPELLALGSGNDLHHGSIGSIAEVVAVLVDGAHRGQHLIQVAGDDHRPVPRDPETVEQFVEILFRGELRALIGAEAVGEEGEGTPCDDLRIELLQGTCRGVARIRERRQPGVIALGVHRCKRLVRHEDLAAHLQQGGGLLPQIERERADGPHVVGDVVTGRAVAAGRGVGQLAAAINQRHRDAVDLGLHGDGDAFPSEVLLQPAVEIDQLRLRHRGVLQFEDIVDAEHRNEVPDLLEAFEGRATDPEGR